MTTTITPSSTTDADPMPTDGRAGPADGRRADASAAALDVLIPIPWLLSSSGLYSWTASPLPGPLPGPFPRPVPTLPTLARQSEELRLDVDGPYPQMTVSGTFTSFLQVRVHWIASLTSTGLNQWSGSIWYKDGPGLMAQTDVTVVSHPTIFHIGQTVTVTFSGAGAATFSRSYRYRSPYFHPVELEYDATPDAHPVTQINTCDHPNRPASLPCETLSLETVYRRAGFAVTKSGGDSIVPLSAAGPDLAWSDNEMHDAMQTSWSRFQNAAQWSLWVFWAALSDRGTGLGGIMFDDIGPNHRQGTAIFTDTFIANAPAGDANPAAWVARMRFWTAAHEMGHAFNLAHSWQESLPTPWIPLADEPEGRTFMNYPYNVIGGQAAFFSDFAFRFSDQELLFLRHAPARFVQMGNASWFDHHGFEQARMTPSPALALEVRANRARPTFEFLEPVTLELKLTNTTHQPCLVDDAVLAPENLTVIIKKDGQPARQWRPYSQLCREPQAVVLPAAASKYAPLRLFAGTNGWDVSEPGWYEVQVALHLADEDVVSDKLRLRVAAPQSWTEEDLATDVFTEDVGRALVFGGTAVLHSANRTLEQVVDRLPDRDVAIHAQLALALPLTKDYRTLDLPGAIRTRPAQPDAAVAGLQQALLAEPGRAAETLTNITYHRRVDTLSKFLADAGDPAAAAASQQVLHSALEAREAKASVLAGVADQEEAYRAMDGKTSARRRTRSKA